MLAQVGQQVKLTHWLQVTGVLGTFTSLLGPPTPRKERVDSYWLGAWRWEQKPSCLVGTSGTRWRGGSGVQTVRTSHYLIMSCQLQAWERHSFGHWHLNMWFPESLEHGKSNRGPWCSPAFFNWDLPTGLPHFGRSVHAPSPVSLLSPHPPSANLCILICFMARKRTKHY